LLSYQLIRSEPICRQQNNSYFSLFALQTQDIQDNSEAWAQNGKNSPLEIQPALPYPI